MILQILMMKLRIGKLHLLQGMKQNQVSDCLQFNLMLNRHSLQNDENMLSIGLILPTPSHKMNVKK